jgi:predicted ATPase
VLDTESVASQIDRLTPSERLVLKVASVVGREFRGRTVCDIFPVAAERPHIGEILQVLVDRGLVEDCASGHTEEYRFQDASCWEAVYGALLYAQRRQLHRAVAEWYEQAFAGELAQHYPVLAHHWRRADEPARAIDYLEKAGQDAVRRGALDQAESFLKESLELNASSAVLSDDFFEASG